MISIPIKEVQLIQEKYQKNIDRQYLNALDKLRDLRLGSMTKQESIYLEAVIMLFETKPNILVDKPMVLREYLSDIGKVPRYKTVDKNGNQIWKKFDIKDKIITALNYSNLRSSFYPKYFSGFGIKTCIYCNAQLAITHDDGQGGISARFDVDHYLPKDDFPWLSISLFNLYPSCGPCNNKKSGRQVSFELYSDDIKKQSTSKFRFGFAPGSKPKYLISMSIEDISCVFIEPKAVRGKHKFNEIFKIEQVYQTQSDVAEELILKSLIYDNAYRKILKENYAVLGINDVSIDRIILGNYTEIKQIHKRPLSKFMQDIAKELNLIK